jgi:hypothetical protein
VSFISLFLFHLFPHLSSYILKGESYGWAYACKNIRQGPQYIPTGYRLPTTTTITLLSLLLLLLLLDFIDYMLWPDDAVARKSHLELEYVSSLIIILSLSNALFTILNYYL